MTSNQKHFLSILAVGILSPAVAVAHAAEQGFVLLLPTTAYITAGTLAVATTMLLLAVLRGRQLERLFEPRTLSGHASSEPPLAVSLTVSVVLAALIFVGLNGPNDPQANLWPLTLWTVWWMALFVVQAVVFDIWSWVNPWPGFHKLLHPSGRGVITLPLRLSVWPAIVVFLAFQGFVLADPAPNDPDRLARFALGYWIFTLAGMSLFGREPWLRQVECFTVLFRLFGTLRPVRRDEGLRVGWPGWHALHNRDLDLSHAAYVIVLLAAGSFDGLHETFWWLGQMGVNPLEYPGRSAMMWSTTVGLYGAIALLFGVFAFVVWVGLKLTTQPPDFWPAFIRFALTLLPIAVGYHFAHYFVTFLVQIQFVTATLADPLARGWNLFGLGNTRVLVGFLAVPETVRIIWLTQAGAVVISHILAVLMSHRTAETLCADHRDVIRVQIGLAILMVAYTVFGLWLLASPRGV